MMAACLAAHAHYLDITGEISVFEHARTLDAAARAAGIVICPGVGFDVIPTDCVAAALKVALPDATHLALGLMYDDPSAHPQCQYAPEVLMHNPPRLQHDPFRS